MVLEHLNTSSVQQAHREDRISFTVLTPWPGDLICAEGRYVEGHADTGTGAVAADFTGVGVKHVDAVDLDLEAASASVSDEVRPASSSSTQR